MHKKWRLRLGSNALVVVRRSDLFPEEAATCDPSLICAQLNGWLTDPISRQIVAEIDETIHGRSARGTKDTDKDDLQHHLKSRMEQAFKRRTIVGLLIPRSFLTQTSQDIADGTQPVPGEPPRPNTPAKRTTWIEIELVNPQGKPVAGERFRIEVPDGTFQEGKLDTQGRARIDGIDPGECQVTFPDIDAKEWTAA